MNKYKRYFILGISLIIISIILGIIFGHDFSFVIAGIGVIITGISILYYINKDSN